VGSPLRQQDSLQADKAHPRKRDRELDRRLPRMRSISSFGWRRLIMGVKALNGVVITTAPGTYNPPIDPLIY